MTASACKRDGGASEIDPDLERRLDHCASTLERLHGIEGSERAAALARGCPYACVGLAPYGRLSRDDMASRSIAPLSEDCQFFCSAHAREAWQHAAPGAQLDSLVGACGHDYYGLRADIAPLFSDTWFVLHRIGEWLVEAQKTLPEGAELAARLDRATASVHIPIPLPARLEGQFELARAEAAEPADTAFYVVVGAHEVRAAAMRVARLRGRGIELRPVPGGSFPGDKLPDGADAAERAYRALETALRELHHDPEVTATPPLLLADSSLSAQRLLDVAAKLGQPKYRLGVAGRRALAHAVQLERIPEHGSAAPAIALAGPLARVPGTDEPIAVGEAGEDTLGEALKHLVALRAPLDRIEVSVDEMTTVADLVALADAAARARIRTFAFAAPGGD